VGGRIVKINCFHLSSVAVETLSGHSSNRLALVKENDVADTGLAARQPKMCKRTRQPQLITLTPWAKYKKINHFPHKSLRLGRHQRIILKISLATKMKFAQVLLGWQGYARIQDLKPFVIRRKPATGPYRPHGTSGTEAGQPIAVASQAQAFANLKTIKITRCCCDA
jgi:hypothetical protein